MSYATLSDLFRFGMPETARASFSDADLEAALASASSTADSYLRGRYAFPLLAYGEDLTKNVCWIAAFEFLTARGYETNTGDSNLLTRWQMATDWLKGVQSKAIHPDITASPNQSPTFDQPVVLTCSVVSAGGRTGRNRGW